jgi:tRNA-dihydrouridine synthase
MRKTISLFSSARRIQRWPWRGTRHRRPASQTDLLPCLVCANGHVYSAAQAAKVLEQTRARGLMIGRDVIRSPWLFDQIRCHLRGEAISHPGGRDVLDYVGALWESQASFDAPDRIQVERMKKFMNLLGEGVDADGGFLHRIRRAGSRDEFFTICREFLNHDRPMMLGRPELSR